MFSYAQSPCTITQLPYACRLDTVPECWSGAGLEYSTTDTFLYLSNQVTLPRFADNLPLNDLTVRMKVKPTTSLALSYYLLVGFKDSVGGTFTPIDTLYPTTTEFKQYEIPIHYQGNARYLCLNTPSMVSFFIKDFVIEQTPLCPCPNQAFLVDVDANSATVSWMPRQNESSWLYSCCEHHTVPTNWTAVSDTFVNINSLVASKRYDFYLKSVCSSAEIGNPIFPVITFDL